MSAAADSSALPPFTGMALDRASTERKDAEWIDARLGDPGSRVVTAGRDGVLVRDGTAAGSAAGSATADGSREGGGEVPVLARDAMPAAPDGETILLGLDGDGAALFAVDLDALEPGERSAAIDGSHVMSLRDAGALMAPAEAGLAAYVMAMLNWHRRHRFCANCGNATDVAEARW
jgi:NAD+ diphosphatase